MADGPTTLHASVSVESHTYPTSDGGEVTHTTIQDDAGNYVGFEDKQTFPDGSSREINTKIDPDSGQHTTTITERDGNNDVIRTGTQERSGEAGVIRTEGDASVFEDDDMGPPRPRDQSGETGSSEGQSTNGDDSSDKPKEQDPEKDGNCTDCGKSEPSIWHDVGVFAWGFVKGAVIGFAITAVMMSVSAPIAAALGVGLAVVGGIGLLWEGWRALSGQMTRDEGLDLAGGFLGGFLGGALAKNIWPKPKLPPPPEKPPVTENPPPSEPVPPPPPPPRPEPAPPPPERPPPRLPPPRGRGVWDLDPKVRGTLIEKRLGQNLPQNFPTIDRYEIETGIVTSIKSVDLAAKSYLNPANLARLGRRYIRQVANFEGKRWAGVKIEPTDIQGRGLDLAIPPGSASPEQRQVLQALIQFGKDLGVDVRIVEIQ